jgi:uncharacterized protein
MSTTHRLTRTEARRVAVRAQLVTAERPSDLLETVRHLTLLVLDRTDAVAPSADLVLWSRLGPQYSPYDLRDAVDQLALVDLRGMLRPIEDIALFRAEMAQTAAWPGPDDGELRDWETYQRSWVHANDGCRREILELLRRDGPLPAGDLPDTCVTPWRSSGWNNRRNVTMMLDLLAQRGEVAVAGRDGRGRLWDLASRIYPDEPAVPVAEARARRAQRRLRALGIARSRAAQQQVEPIDVGEIGEAAEVEGVRGRWRVDPAVLGQPFEGRAALLSPFDLLLRDRRRMAELFEYDYRLEMYVATPRRRWGYYALPILYGDRLVGKLDATADRDAGVLRVHAVHQDVAFTRAMVRDVRREIHDLASWLGLIPVPVNVP